MYDAYWHELDHTADIAIHIWGANLSALFTHAAGATVSLIGENLNPPGEPAARHIVLSADDSETLLVDWLTELLILTEEGIAVTDITINSITPTELNAYLKGTTGAYFSNHIKAVTYTGLALEETQRGIETRIVYDV